MTIRLGLQIPNFSYGTGVSELFPTVIAQAQEAEAAGFDSVFVMDHFYQLPGLGTPDQPMLEAYTALGALATATQKVQLGTLVTGNTYRNPTLLAKAITTLDVVSAGRAILGIGTGWFELEHDSLGFEFGTFTERFKKLDEALQIIHDIAKSSNFQRVLALPEMRAQLKRLQPVLPGGCESDLFKSRIADQRDWIGAHLDERAIERAMHYRASFPRRDIGKIEFSTSPWCTRMYGAEDILTTIVVRHAWDLMQEGDELEALGAERAGWFTGVAADVELFLAQLMVGLKELQEI